MEIDRRSFFRLLGAGLAVLSGRPASARSRDRAPEIHSSTRNTVFGGLGRKLWPNAALLPFKSYPGAKRIGLPALETQPGLALAEAVRGYTLARGFEPAALSISQLGRLLYFSNGVTSVRRSGSRSIRLRAAPSAGALYAGEVYVVAERVRELAAGVYYYDVHRHALVRLQDGSRFDEVVRAVEDPGQLENAAAAILLSNVFARYAGRYANRGYRYSLIDSGHIGEKLRLAATSAGLAEASPLRFHDDRLNALIEVDGRAEAVCALHAVGRRATSRAAPPRPLRRLVEMQRASDFSMPAGPVPTRYHEATKLVAGDPGRPPPALEPEAPKPPSAAQVPLARSGKAPGATVEWTIEQRRSAAWFDSDPIPLDDLSFVLEMAGGHEALRRSEGVDLYVVANRVAGLESGIYRLERRARRLALVRPGDPSRAMTQSAMGQERAGRAAAGVLMVARFAPGSPDPGPRRYRDLLLDSGGVGQRVYLAAEAVGLAARNLAAFFDDDFNELLGLDARREAVIHFTAVGPGR